MQAPDPLNFLDDGTVEELLQLVYFPRSFESCGYEDVDYAGRFKSRYTSPGHRLAIAPEDLLEIHGSPLLEISPASEVEASRAIPWAPRGQVNVPIFKAQGVVVLSFIVPTGYRYWIDGYAFGLFPSQGLELNYFWQLRIDGTDMLNKAAGVMMPGRPIQSPDKVTIGRSRDTMFLAQPSSLVEVVVTAIATVGASDSVSACVFGQLEGLQP